jgi:hypothetical protein
MLRHGRLSFQTLQPFGQGLHIARASKVQLIDSALKAVINERL